MTTYHVPPYLIDPDTVPRLLATSEPGSFARYTFQVRIPHILEETIAQNRFTGKIRADLEALRHEIAGGKIRELQDEAGDVTFWNALAEPFVERSWLDVPWYWAEAYFYRRLLAATRYFPPGPAQGRDPFAVAKSTEWRPEGAPRAAGLVLAAMPTARDEILATALQASLWGNRIDLSYQVVADLGLAARLEEEHTNLLVDDTRRVVGFLRDRAPAQVVIISDNAGTELTMDLVLVDALLSTGLAQQVTLHVKPQPFFVSDAMIHDVKEGVAALAAAGREASLLAARLESYFDDGRLRLHTHWFYATSLFYYQMAEDLLTDLGRADFVILKGDANYRRLIGDAHWPHTTSFQQVTAYFPAPLVSLRTLKSELMVGLAPGQAERLRAEDSQWLVNGRRGVIQCRL